MKKYVALLFLLISFSGYAQSTINDYKYVLVPEKFSFLRMNEYGLNTKTRTLLEQKGFVALFDNADIPKELAGNRCNALIADVVQKKNMFVTNLTLILKDCQGNIIFKSKEGKSREKEFATSYNLALTDAFTTLDTVPYAYNGTVKMSQPQQAVTAPAAPTVTPSAPPITPAAAQEKPAAGTLYAQATANGYQLIDTAPKIVLTILKTSVQDYFIADGGESHGIVLKKNGDWYFEYYKENQLISEKLLIKF